MRITIFCLLIFAFVYARAQAPSPDLYKEGEWILMTAPGSRLPALPEGAELIRPLSERTGAWLVRVAPGVILTGDFALQPNYYLSPRNTTPDDPFFSSQWNLERIEAHRAWEFATGGATALGDQIVVAVIDNGFDLDHPDLSESALLPGWNFDTQSSILPIRPHGTAVMGILAARGNNGKGIAGVNWEVQVLPLVTRTIGHIIEAFDYVFEIRQRYNQTGGAEGAFIVAASASLGFDKTFCSEFPSLNDIIDSLGSVGALAVAATANGNWDVDIEGDLPTTCQSDFLIAVTNTDRNDIRYADAAFGAASIDLSAPGGGPEAGVFTTYPPGDYTENFGGTSAACPHVSGAAALLYAMPSVELAQMAREHPEQAARLVKEAILNGVDIQPSLQDITLTGGRLNIYRSALYLHGYFQNISIPDPIQYADRRRLIRIFPNPLRPGDPIRIAYGSRDLAPVVIRLFNATGQLLAQTTATPEPFSTQDTQLPTENLVAGFYWVVLDNGISPIAEKIIVY
jgi:subtilisin family serine protease